MHLKRWLTGIIALPILIFLIGSQHRWPLYILLYTASVAALIEFYRMTEPEPPKFVRWSSYLLSDIPRENRLFPHYCVVQINNVFNSPVEPGDARWVAFPRPHVIFQYYDGLSGQLRYAETIHASR